MVHLLAYESSDQALENECFYDDPFVGLFAELATCRDKSGHFGAVRWKSASSPGTGDPIPESRR
jgi:hypothetical protein